MVPAYCGLFRLIPACCCLLRLITAYYGLLRLITAYCDLLRLLATYCVQVLAGGMGLRESGGRSPTSCGKGAKSSNAGWMTGAGAMTAADFGGRGS